ncbi:MAG: deoxynucleoside kinase [Deltaproteobacteria bacterium]|nr:deoxynucleoside kinase [Deltaproteobacteria bacterium]
MNRNIAVAGNIGSGKDLLIDFLCSTYPLLPIGGNPTTANPYLEFFFTDMKCWAFHSQIHILTEKFKHLQASLSGFRSSVIKRSIYEDAEIFARDLFQNGFLSELEFRTYYEYFKTVTAVLPAPDLLIYLHSSLKTSIGRVQARQHADVITPAYLKRLNRLYVNWIADYNLSEVLIIDTDQLDFVGNLVDRADIIEVVERYI